MAPPRQRVTPTTIYQPKQVGSNGNGKKSGRPSTYHMVPADTLEGYDCNSMPARAYKFMRELGGTEEQLADILGVTYITLRNWKFAYPAFFKAIQDGKDEYDTYMAERSLLKRVNGFAYKEQQLERGTYLDAEGKVKEGMVVTKETVKYLPPETKAIHIWLRNRHRDRWGEKVFSGDDTDMPQAAISQQTNNIQININFCRPDGTPKKEAIDA